MSRIRELAQRITNNFSAEREKAVALHDYVRDNIKFGFNRYFDLSTPDNTLDLGIGHCNPKGWLIAALFREANIEAYNHFVVLPKELIKGAVSPDRYWLIPARLSHCYTEVKVEGACYNIDSYVLDGPLFKAGRAKLSEEGRAIGYGTHMQSTIDWDGKSDAFSQFDKDMMIEDHGRVDSLETYYRSDRYRNKVFGVRLNSLFRIMGKSMEARSKLHLDKLREQYSAFAFLNFF
jgi:hypothetical protein